MDSAAGDADKTKSEQQRVQHFTDLDESDNSWTAKVHRTRPKQFHSRVHVQKLISAYFSPNHRLSLKMDGTARCLDRPPVAACSICENPCLLCVVVWDMDQTKKPKNTSNKSFSKMVSVILGRSCHTVCFLIRFDFVIFCYKIEWNIVIDSWRLTHDWSSACIHPLDLDTRFGFQMHEMAAVHIREDTSTWLFKMLYTFQPPPPPPVFPAGPTWCAAAGVTADGRSSRSRSSDRVWSPGGCAGAATGRRRWRTSWCSGDTCVVWPPCGTWSESASRTCLGRWVGTLCIFGTQRKGGGGECRNGIRSGCFGQSKKYYQTFVIIHYINHSSRTGRSPDQTQSGVSF